MNNEDVLIELADCIKNNRVFMVGSPVVKQSLYALIVASRAEKAALITDLEACSLQMKCGEYIECSDLLERAVMAIRTLQHDLILPKAQASQCQIFLDEAMAELKASRRRVDELENLLRLCKGSNDLEKTFHWIYP